MLGTSSILSFLVYITETYTAGYFSGWLQQRRRCVQQSEFNLLIIAVAVTIDLAESV